MTVMIMVHIHVRACVYVFACLSGACYIHYMTAIIIENMRACVCELCT